MADSIVLLLAMALTTLAVPFLSMAILLRSRKTSKYNSRLRLRPSVILRVQDPLLATKYP